MENKKENYENEQETIFDEAKLHAWYFDPAISEEERKKRGQTFIRTLPLMVMGAAFIGLIATLKAEGKEPTVESIAEKLPEPMASRFRSAAAQQGAK